jgi:S-adenosylmethionine:tRNA ribosyltransferase-isomerase
MTVNRMSGEIGHYMMRELPRLVPANCVAVFNNSRVRKARIYAVSGETGGSVEFLLLSTRNGNDWAFLSNRSRRVRPGRTFVFPENLNAVITADSTSLLLHFERPVTDDYLERCGCMPLPPYIRRKAETSDSDRYQTVYAEPVGSSAAPTAGLHFTPRLLADMDAAGVSRVMVTLHVGLGTFLPVREPDIENPHMHEEEYWVSEEAAETVNRGRREGRPVLAVGTTSVRVLETATVNGTLESGRGATSIFLYPGRTLKAVDCLFTNFHTPESTLLMLVSAFAGKDLIFKAYAEAIKEKYNFFSYGDAMLIL